MAKTIQVRDVPDDVHHRLKVRAAERRMSLSEFVREELIHVAGVPTVPEWLERLEEDEPIKLPPGGGAEVIRAVREEREAELLDRILNRDRR